MKTKISLMLILAVFSLSMVSGAFATTDDSIPVIKVTDLNTKLNEHFKITLDSNPSTGYGWYYDYDPEYLQLVDEYFIPNTDDPLMVGSGGKSVFVFKALKIGETDLTMKYLRPWENCLPAEEIIYKVKITP